MESAVHDKPSIVPVRNLETERLCDEYFERASDALERLHTPGMMNLEETNGFLTALACESSLAHPEDYINSIAGAEFVNKGSDEDYAEYVGLLSEQMDLIRRVFDNGEIFFPLLLPDEAGELKGNDWAHGFGRAFASTDFWDPLMDDKDHWHVLTSMLVLDTEHRPLADEPPRPPITPEQREELLAMISVAVREIYKYFESDRLQESEAAEKLPAAPPPIDPAERSDLAHADRLLARLQRVGALDLEALDGFLTAMGCGPSVVDPAGVISCVLGNIEEGAFPESELREICGFIVRRYDEIGRILDEELPLPHRPQQSIAKTLCTRMGERLCFGNADERGAVAATVGRRAIQQRAHPDIPPRSQGRRNIVLPPRSRICRMMPSGVRCFRLCRSVSLQSTCSSGSIVSLGGTSGRKCPPSDVQSQSGAEMIRAPAVLGRNTRNVVAFEESTR